MAKRILIGLFIGDTWLSRYYYVSFMHYESWINWPIMEWVIEIIAYTFTECGMEH